MAVRVRKLARQLKRSPAEVLGLLHVLGYPRYRSSEDMVADPVAAKARTAAQQGVRAAPIAPESERKVAPKVARATKPDLMASLVPGVVRQGASAPSAAKPRPAPTPTPTPISAPAPAPTAKPKPVPPPAPVPPQPDVSEFTSRIADLEAQLGQRDQRIADLQTQLASVSSQPSDLEAVLAARGLLGRDEFGRALAALAQARVLDPALFAVADKTRLEQVLRDRLVLFGGDIPESLSGAAGVSVALDRADLPGATALRARLDKLGEQLMLHGLRNVRAVGVPPRWHRLIRSLVDSRIELTIDPGGPRDRSRAAKDVAGVDAVWLWDVSGDEGAQEAWQKAPLFVDGPADLDGAMKALLEALAAR